MALTAVWLAPHVVSRARRRSGEVDPSLPGFGQESPESRRVFLRQICARRSRQQSGYDPGNGDGQATTRRCAIRLFLLGRLRLGPCSLPGHPAVAIKMNLGEVKIKPNGRVRPPWGDDMEAALTHGHQRRSTPPKRSRRKILSAIVPFLINFLRRLSRRR